MKVSETGTDRIADVHVYVDGKIRALEEYGEYVDPSDKALCCYVPVEEGHKVKIRGKFSGTVSTDHSVMIQKLINELSDIGNCLRRRSRWGLSKSQLVRGQDSVQPEQ